MVGRLARGRKRSSVTRKSRKFEDENRKYSMSKSGRYCAKQREMSIVKRKRRKRTPYFRGLLIQKLLRKMKSFLAWMNIRNLLKKEKLGERAYYALAARISLLQKTLSFMGGVYPISYGHNLRWVFRAKIK